MRVRLITDGGYNCMQDVEVPVEVEAVVDNVCGDLIHVTSKELVRIGAKGRSEDDSDLCFEIDTECEVLSE